MAMSREDIFEKVQEVLVDALGLDDDEVTYDATLMGDLGAESIDFLDITFNLEKEFDIKIPREELFPIDTIMGNPESVKEGKLTAAGLADLKAKMPHTDFTDLTEGFDVSKLPDFFTVESIVNFIEKKVA